MFDRIMGTPSFDRVESLYQGKCDQVNDLDSSRDKPSIGCLIFAQSSHPQFDRLHLLIGMIQKASLGMSIRQAVHAPLCLGTRVVVIASAPPSMEDSTR